MHQVLALLGLLLICLQAGPALAHTDPGEWVMLSVTGGFYSGSSAGQSGSPTPVSYTVSAGKHLVIKQAYALKGNETWYQNSAYPNQPAPYGGTITINGYRVTFTVNAPSLLDWHFVSGSIVNLAGSLNTNGYWSCFLVDALACECAGESPAPSTPPPSSEPSTSPPSSEPTTSPAPGGGGSETLFPGFGPQMATDFMLLADKVANIVLGIMFLLLVLRKVVRFV